MLGCRSIKRKCCKKITKIYQSICCDNTALDVTQQGMAEMYLRFNSNVQVNNYNGKYCKMHYYYANEYNIWIDDGPEGLNIEKDLCTQFRDILIQECRVQQHLSSANNQAKWKKTIKMIETQLKNDTPTKSIMKKIYSLVSSNEKMDNEQGYVAINGVCTFSSTGLRIFKPELSQNYTNTFLLGIKLSEYNEKKQQEFRTEWLHKIHPQEKSRRTYMQFVSAKLNNKDRILERFLIGEGKTGRNGKSSMHAMERGVFGKYYMKVMYFVYFFNIYIYINKVCII